ncbi:hypothetical protein Scep_022381 [Stephania cephalantha]|uniref:Uncharacterized protein n=1 Tax=Stephania cephalantha TaxID=152367 RepID=A0AAP0I0X4_9MAGN
MKSVHSNNEEVKREKQEEAAIASPSSKHGNNGDITSAPTIMTMRERDEVLEKLWSKYFERISRGEGPRIGRPARSSRTAAPAAAAARLQRCSAADGEMAVAAAAGSGVTTGSGGGVSEAVATGSGMAATNARTAATAIGSDRAGQRRRSRRAEISSGGRQRRRLAAAARQRRRRQWPARWRVVGLRRILD